MNSPPSRGVKGGHTKFRGLKMFRPTTLRTYLKGLNQASQGVTTAVSPTTREHIKLFSDIIIASYMLEVHLILCSGPANTLTVFVQRSRTWTPCNMPISLKTYLASGANSEPNSQIHALVYTYNTYVYIYRPMCYAKIVSYSQHVQPCTCSAMLCR